ncbi:MAG: Holliday junction branch migration protein RuvA [Clostridiales bacterium]|jgi:Holliday junction DNA helicase RuvA|nr:Holliday junction branch migration protein RuvA [Clostridiales bacterium]
MIYCLTGELLELDALAMTAVIDCCGVGYKVAVTGNTLTKLSQPAAAKEKTRLYTYMAVREDAVELYGFYTTEEMDTFRMLISVSGVGPKAAVAILSIMTPAALSAAIQAEDAKALSKAQGVGGKTAARIVLELKDKFAKKLFADAPAVQTAPAAASGGHLSDARDALLVLGYSRNEITTALQGIDPAKDTEEIIRMALAKLMK